MHRVKGEEPAEQSWRHTGEPHVRVHLRVSLSRVQGLGLSPIILLAHAHVGSSFVSYTASVSACLLMLNHVSFSVRWTAFHKACKAPSSSSGCRTLSLSRHLCCTLTLNCLELGVVLRVREHMASMHGNADAQLANGGCLCLSVGRIQTLTMFAHGSILPMKSQQQGRQPNSNLIALVCQVHGGVDLRLSMKKAATHHRVPSDEALLTAHRKFAHQNPALKGADSAPLATPPEPLRKPPGSRTEGSESERQAAMAAVRATKSKGSLLPGVDVVSHSHALVFMAVAITSSSLMHPQRDVHDDRLTHTQSMHKKR